MSKLIDIPESVNSLMDGDYNRFCGFTYPEVHQMMENIMELLIRKRN